MSYVLFEPGRAYSFYYPRHNYAQTPPSTELRRIIVGSVRDTRNQPLDRITESLNPFLLRGRWLVTGLDLDKEQERSFYAESMTKIRALSQDDLNPLKGFEYLVVDQAHVAYKGLRLRDALRFRSRRDRGAVCAVLGHGPRPIARNADDTT